MSRAREVFVAAGEPGQPADEFESAAALLRAVAKVGHSPSRSASRPIRRVTRHQRRDHDPGDVRQAPLATYIVSQDCFDPEVNGTWIPACATAASTFRFTSACRDRRRQQARRFSGRIGLGKSARFLHRHGHGLVPLLLPHAYRPERLLVASAPHLARPDNRIAGPHVYTFNEIERAQRWRRETIARFAGRGL